MKVRSLPEEDRPREKLASHGPSALTDSELLALLLGSGTRGVNVVEMAQTILLRFGGLRGLLNLDMLALRSIKGIGKSKASLLLALSELCYRTVNGSKDLTSKDDIIRALQARKHNVEEAFIIALDNKGTALGHQQVSLGAEGKTILSAAEVLRAVLRLGGQKFLFVHTHPSGVPYPSKQDIVMTDALTLAATQVGINLEDHLILGNSARFSFRENGVI